MLGKNDFSFFAAIDMLVRESMKEFEKRLLPTFQQATQDTGVPVEDVPAEGYYSESAELKEVLRHWRALQNNQSDTVTDAVRRLHSIYNEHDVFGLGPAKATALNPNPLNIGQDFQYAVISPMFDTLAVAIQMVMNKKSPDDWSIQRIMTEAEEIELGTHLVGLAVLVDQTYKNKSQDGKYNPVASTMGAETTVGSRYVPMLLGAEPRPVISPKVEQKGMKVVDAYNELFTSVPEGEGLLLPTSLSTILDKTDELDMLKIVGRCVRVGEDLRDKRVVYHWAITMDMDSVRVGGLRAVETYPLCLKTVEFRRPDVVTSEEFRADQDKYVTK